MNITGKPDKIGPFELKPMAAEELMTKELPIPRWAIPNLIPDGLTFFCGPPKIGKSWGALDWAIAVVTGGLAFGRLQVEQGEALYLGLEDSNSRMQKRLRKLLPDGKSPKGLYVLTRTNGFPPLDKGGLKALEDWLEKHPNVKLVILDTWARAKSPHKGNQNIYEADVAALAPLQDLAFRHNLALVAIHHIRKQKADDVLATVSGSYGIAGTADCIIILTRTSRKETATLTVTGRDIEDQERGLRFSDGKWELSESSNEAILSPLRQSIIDAIQEDGPMTPTQVAKRLDRHVSTIKTTLSRMTEGGLLVAENGVYSVPLDEIT